MSKPLTYVQIGVGGFGHWWCNVFLPRLTEMGLAKAVAAVDINPEVLPNAKQPLGLEDGQLYTDAEKAISETRPDFVTIVVPPAFHEQMVDIALKYNCHILSEKPIADSMEVCCRIYKKVRSAGRKMAVTMSHRFDQDKQSLERLIKSGDYGALDYIVGRNTWNCRKFPAWGAFRYKIPDTLLVEGTVHHFDIMRSLTGSDAKTVHALTWNPAWSDFAGDSQGLILIEMESGVRVFYEGAKSNSTTLNTWGHDYWRAECEKATLILDNRKLCTMSDLSGEHKVVDVPLAEQPVWMNSWLAELFVNWVNGGETPPNSLDDNIQCAALLFAAIESAHTGKIVPVQEYLERHLKAV